MRIRVGCGLYYECPQPTPMLLILNIHYTRASDLVITDHIVTNPPVPITAFEPEGPPIRDRPPCQPPAGPGTESEQ